ncbi:MAG: AraC family transcriptional regulator [Cytophagaceae bacterium]|jgi:AraC-like DNA-binding protein|nr:AraC family transcriptional regulator [Cytophagaceae bacterium]
MIFEWPSLTHPEKGNAFDHFQSEKGICIRLYKKEIGNTVTIPEYVRHQKTVALHIHLSNELNKSIGRCHLSNKTGTFNIYTGTVEEVLEWVQQNTNEVGYLMLLPAEWFNTGLLQSLQVNQYFSFNLYKSVSAWYEEAAILLSAYRSIFLQIIETSLGELHSIYLQAKVTEWLILLVQKQKFNDVPREFQFVFQLLHKHLNAPLSITELSKQTGMNVDKLKKGIKKITGNTIFQYITKQRMEIAKSYLIKGEFNITEIATMMGYQNPQHFTVAFKKYVGVLPKEYKG